MEKLLNKSKIFWSIGDLSNEFDVTARTLRFYEDKGLLSPIREGQKRKYTARDRARLILVLRGKRIGFSLEDLKEMLDLYDLEGGKKHQLQTALAKFKEQLLVLENQKNDIIAAIGDLKSNIDRVEENLQNYK
ncbi:MAG: MerR family DNA-binding transcriptional regulator [Proteobacteria bacterium]|nr:MerR family DNA-binding transcriptional regulator [Pseudomonadota bacterium]